MSIATGKAVKAFDLVKRLSKAVDELKIDSTCDSGSAVDSIIDSSLPVSTSVRPENMIGCYVNFWDSDNPSLRFDSFVTAFDRENTKIFVSPDFAAIPAANDPYIVTERKIADYLEILNQALEMTYGTFLISVQSDNGILIASGTEEYSLPTLALDLGGTNTQTPPYSTFEYVEKLLRDSDGDSYFTDQIPDKHWTILPSGKLWIHKSSVGGYDARYVRVLGQISHPPLNYVDDMCVMNESLLISLAAYRLLEMKGVTNSTEARDRVTKMYYYDGKQALARSPVGARGRRVPIGHLYSSP